MNDEIVVVDGRREMARDVAQSEELSVTEVAAQVQKVKELMRAVMKDGVHYGTIPGTPKPTLYKPGAELLCMLFKLEAQHAITKEHDGAHREVESLCTLYHIPTGQRRGSGLGSCSTKETKYAYRNSARKCPNCGKESIIKGKEEWGGGWVCFKKKDGCGAKFRDGVKEIEGQSAGRVANEDIADAYNTVLKMANKRALVAAVLNVTAASDCFTQDLEDFPEAFGEVRSPTYQPCSEPDEPGRAYEDPPHIMAMMAEVEDLIGQGRITEARALLGSKAKPRMPGSVSLANAVAHEANQISEDYRKQVGKRWQALNRQIEKHERTAVQPIQGEFIDADNDGR